MGILSLSTAGLTNFQKYSSMLAGNAPYMPSSFDLLQTYTLASSQASVTFSSLGDYAADYQHLQIRYTARSNRSDVDSVLKLKFNEITGANYTSHNLAGTGSSVISANYTSNSSDGIYMPYSAVGATGTSNVWAASVIDILDAFNSNKFTTVRGLIGQPNAAYMRLSLHSGAFLNTASITSLTFTDQFGSLIAGSRFSLYGLRKAA